MRRRFVLSALLVSCGARTEPRGAAVAGDSGPSDATPPTFPTGTFVNCTRGEFHPSDTGAFLNSVGVRSGASLTLAYDGPALTVRHEDENGRRDTLRFSAATAAAAQLDPAGQSLAGLASLCVQGPGRLGSVPARLDASAGVLTYDTRNVFLLLDGIETEINAGPCGVRSTAARVWFVCDLAPGVGPLAPPASAQETRSSFPAGDFNCTSQVGTYQRSNGLNLYSASGGTGTLTLTPSDREVVARYAGDGSVTGTLRFATTSPATARAITGQGLVAPCPVTGGTPGPPERVTLSTAALLLDAATIVLSFVGATASDATSACPGTAMTGSVLCVRR